MVVMESLPITKNLSSGINLRPYRTIPSHKIQLESNILRDKELDRVMLKRFNGLKNQQSKAIQWGSFCLPECTKLDVGHR